MAQRVMVVCDLHDDEVPGYPTRFSLDGTPYEVDLCDEHAGELHDVLSPYLAAARRKGGTTGTTRRGRGRRGGARPQQSTQEIREWARQQGHDVSDRGRIPARLIEEFAAAHR